VAQALLHPVVAIADEEFDGDEAPVLWLGHNHQIRVRTGFDLLTSWAVSAGIDFFFCVRFAKQRLGQFRRKEPLPDSRRADKQESA
jgi:hypothetical protein